MTHETLEDHKQGISFVSLPLTQREAILATIYLGIRYLWIDSLCVIQDSAQDWEIEAPRMGSVYSKALVTFAATSSSSPEDGLLLPFQSARCVEVHGETAIIRMETHMTIDEMSEPLNTRAWTLQETVLASRLVCFGKEQWLWKCPSRYTTEDGLVDSPQIVNNGLVQWVGIVQQGPGEDGQNFLRHWYRLVSDYSRRHLTNQSDKLKAIARLADMFAKQTGYHYVAGLWAEDLVIGLMWEPKSPDVTHETKSIPSWSWASMSGQVEIPQFSKQSSTPLLELVSVEQEWQGIPFFSQLEVARLTIKGKMIRASLSKGSLNQEQLCHQIAGPGTEDLIGEGFLDCALSTEQDMSSVWYMPAYSVQKEAGDLEYHFLIIIPVPCESQESNIAVCRRVGHGVIRARPNSPGKEADGDDLFANVFATTIALV
ncbi:tol [Fusarium albosuccineum]|uniref:Tol n=1 Tax=Fusarium albosuccineum TaxID=1237068 RepID=A0A8H4KES1_9HYPO|nr:tol [Fusarium albosuccineum]